MHYFSTSKKSAPVSFRKALFNGQPNDRGLYFPSQIPALPTNFVESLKEKSKAEIAFDVIKPYIGEEIDDSSLYQICAETVGIEFPLVKINDSISTLELFHGPTFAFKDIGARFMSLCLQYFSKDSAKKTIVIVATSGDTGGAVANGFYGLNSVEVVILYPKGRVSRLQELQITTLGNNVTAVEVDANFDECQAMAKNALADETLRKAANLTSANSINVARWLPQQFYYFFAYQELTEKQIPPVICVPSGNFGNVCAGILANRAGLPCKQFIAATNANDVIPQFLKSGEMKEKNAVPTLSNAMDIGKPSNFVRILEIFANNLPNLSEFLVSESISDERTIETIKRVYAESGYILDPHGAVGYCALEDYLKTVDAECGYFLETAHPAKFDVVSEILGVEIPAPNAANELLNKEANKIEMNADYSAYRKLLLSKAND
ncbi:MAG: threonine synthase [Pyrinomonadaceae bacterium]